MMAQKNALYLTQYYCRLQNTLDLKRTNSGFTLVEVLVALALSTLLMLGLSHSFQNFAKTEARILEVVDSMDKNHTSTEFVQQIISNVNLRNLNPDASATKNTRFFRLSPDSIEWLGMMPLRHSVSSENFFKIAAVKLDGFNSIVLFFTPTTTEITTPNWSAAESRVLFKDISQFQISVEFAKMQDHEPSNGPKTEWMNVTPSKQEVPIRIQFNWIDQKGHSLFIASPIFILDQYRDPTVAVFPK